MTAPWLTIVGIGEDGADGLGLAAREAIGAAEAVFGGARHLELAAGLIQGEAIGWPSPLADALPRILAWRPRPVAVLASGDPFWFGVGALLARHVPLTELRCLPALSAFALACAQLGWSLQDVATISFCGRPLDALMPLLQPGARILALSADAATPGKVAARVHAAGFGLSRLRVLEALGGPRERVRDYAGHEDIAPLNLLAIEVVAGPGARPIPLASGLADDLFQHDGQLTKREIRAVTLSSLAPRRGELLWDVGCGSGSVGIEWLLRHEANRAVAIEARADRAERAGRNAAALGVSYLRVVVGAAPVALAGLAAPDAVFIGGGAHEAGVIDAAWAALRPDGRLVVNAVTVETEATLLAAQARLGGTLTRIGIERLGMLGGRRGFRPAMTVTQFVAVKP